MTYGTNARVAGVTYFVYLAAGIGSLVLSGRAHATDVLSVLTSFSALVLGVTLYAITREQDPDIAMLGLTCRVVEGIPWRGHHLLRRGQHALRLAPPARPDDSHRIGLARRACGGPARRDLLVQRAGLVGGAVNWSSPVTWLMSLPMLVFEPTLAVWLIVKGVAAPRTKD